MSSESPAQFVGQGTFGGQPFTLEVRQPERGWLDPSIYAPALPGVLVALVGLWAAHYFAQKRDRRKEILDASDKLKKLADGAAEAAVAAWLAAKGVERTRKIHEAKEKLQALGTAATTLKRRSTIRAFRFSGLRPHRVAIDVTKNVHWLRRVATQDPFEDPDREPDERQLGSIAFEVANLHSEVDRGTFEVVP